MSETKKVELPGKRVQTAWGVGVVEYVAGGVAKVRLDPQPSKYCFPDVGKISLLPIEDAPPASSALTPAAILERLEDIDRDLDVTVLRRVKLNALRSELRAQIERDSR